MAEVQLFGDYLNLYEHSIAARGGTRAEEGRGWEGRGGGDIRGSKRTEEEEKITGENQRAKKRVEEKSPSQEGLEMKRQREGGKVHLGKIATNIVW